MNRKHINFPFLLRSCDLLEMPEEKVTNSLIGQSFLDQETCKRIVQVHLILQHLQSFLIFSLVESDKTSDKTSVNKTNISSAVNIVSDNTDAARTESKCHYNQVKELQYLRQVGVSSNAAVVPGL